MGRRTSGRSRLVRQSNAPQPRDQGQGQPRQDFTGQGGPDPVAGFRQDGYGPGAACPAATKAPGRVMPDSSRATRDNSPAATPGSGLPAGTLTSRRRASRARARTARGVRRIRPALQGTRLAHGTAAPAQAATLPSPASPHSPASARRRDSPRNQGRLPSRGLFRPAASSRNPAPSRSPGTARTGSDSPAAIRLAEALTTGRVRAASAARVRPAWLPAGRRMGPRNGYPPNAAGGAGQQSGFAPQGGYPQQGGYAQQAGYAQQGGAQQRPAPERVRAPGRLRARRIRAPERLRASERIRAPGRVRAAARPGAQNGFAPQDGFGPQVGGAPRTDSGRRFRPVRRVRGPAWRARGGPFPGPGPAGGFAPQQPGRFPGAQPHDQFPPAGQAAAYPDATQFTAPPQFPGGPATGRRSSLAAPQVPQEGRSTRAGRSSRERRR